MRVVALAFFVACLALEQAHSDGGYPPVTAKDLIARSQATKSLTEFISTLPPDLFKQSLLNIASHSLQTGTLEHPRVILFSGNLTIGYAGAPGTSAGVEMIEYRPEKARYDFYRLTFGNAGASAEKNPAICKSCHTPSLRPIWPTKMMLPWFNGFMGTLSTPTLRDAEDEHLRAFINANKQHPLYAPVISHVDHQEPARWFYRQNSAYENILDEQMVQFTATRLEAHPRFAQMLSPLLTVFSSRIKIYAEDFQVGGFDFARELSPFLGKDISTEFSEARARTSKTLYAHQGSKFEMHEKAVERDGGYVRLPSLDSEAQFFAALQMVLDHYGAKQLMDEIFSMSSQAMGPEMLGVNLNPWFYPGKLERELLRRAGGRA